MKWKLGLSSPVRIEIFGSSEDLFFKCMKPLRMQMDSRYLFCSSQKTTKMTKHIPSMVSNYTFAVLYN